MEDRILEFPQQEFFLRMQDVPALAVFSQSLSLRARVFLVVKRAVSMELLNIGVEAALSLSVDLRTDSAEGLALFAAGKDSPGLLAGDNCGKRSSS